MKARPIIFSAPMVRALLEGRKSQTRRIVKPPSAGWRIPENPVLGRITSKHPKQGKFGVFVQQGEGDFYQHDLVPCPYGQPGDRLWVKETHARYQTINHLWHHGGRVFDEVSDGLVAYKADGFNTIDDLKEHIRLMSGHDLVAIEVENDRWRPSIFMHRWASRILLEITGIRVERLQDISEEDAVAEGIAPNWIDDLEGWIPDEHGYLPHDVDAEGNAPGVDIYDSYWTAKRCYRRLWESIHGADSWDANPWVWVISFKRIEP